MMGGDDVGGRKELAIVSDTDVSLAAMLATLRSDIAHVGLTVEQMRLDFKEWKKESREFREKDQGRFRTLEQDVASVQTVCNFRTSLRDGNDTKIGTRMDELEKEVASLRSEVRKYGFFGGATGGVGLAGLVELLKGLIK